VASGGGGVAPVVVDERGEVLQLKGDQRVRRRRSIEEWSSSEGAHRKGADGGDARTESGAEEGLQQRKASETDAWAVGEACASLGHGRTRRTARGGEKDRLVAPFKGRRGIAERGGGPAMEMPRGAGVTWGLALTDGQHPDRVPADHGPAATRAGGVPLFRQWRTDAADARASTIGGRGSEKRDARARVGRPGERGVG
jgi:hypothetical protein